MKVLATFLAIILICFSIIGGIGYLVFTADHEQPPAQTPTPTPEPTNQPVVEQCMSPHPNSTNAPGETITTLQERTITSTALEKTITSTLTNARGTGLDSPVAMNENASIVARQHAKAAVTGSSPEYQVSTECTLSTYRTDILAEDVPAPTSESATTTILNSFNKDVIANTGGHDATGIGVYITDRGEIHVSIVTLDTPN